MILPNHLTRFIETQRLMHSASENREEIAMTTLQPQLINRRFLTPPNVPQPIAAPAGLSAEDLDRSGRRYAWRLHGPWLNNPRSSNAVRLPTFRARIGRRPIDDGPAWISTSYLIAGNRGDSR